MARVGEIAAVHLDARDSCGQPRLSGNDSWRVTIKRPNGAVLPVAAVHDLHDGTYRVEFVAQDAGMHHIEATLHGDERHFKATFEAIAS